MPIKKNIRVLRITSFLLFLTPAIALIGSLIFHNLLISFTFSHGTNFKFEKNIPGTTIEVLCTKQNDYCNKLGFEKVGKLNECNKHNIDLFILLESGDIINVNKELNIELDKLKKKELKYQISNKLNKNCIKNSNLIKYYKFAPSIFENIFKLKNSEKISLGTSGTVNPIFYGETSISNIVKRFPVNILFKPLMYLSIIFMIFYWYYNNLVLNKLLKEESRNSFFIFGVLSAIFLLFHVFFLGWTFENAILTKLRRYFIVFFILFEVLAQALLIKNIFKRKFQISIYLNYIVVYLKLAFVFFVCSSTLTILIILIFHDFDSKIDYILEWNYFLILLIFYFLSSIMWKKNNN